MLPGKVDHPILVMRVAVICGGKSAEHEISIVSAKNILNALASHERLAIVVTRKGEWFCTKDMQSLSQIKGEFTGEKGFARVTPLLGKGELLSLEDHSVIPLDVVFPIIHGQTGEDGSLQGLFEHWGIPFIGPGVMASALGMDKDMMKQVLRPHQIPLAKTIVLRKSDKIDIAKIIADLSTPLFVKPSSQGSSVGVNKATSPAELETAIQRAFEFDDKILVEEAIVGKEVECAILGNKNPKASILGEIVPRHTFYSYEAKYQDDEGADLRIPAEIPEVVSKKIQDYALEIFAALELEGMTRIDFFVTAKHEIYLNEVNTLPGFTSISMYPKLWEKTGLPPQKLMDELLNLALERYQRKSKLIIKS